MSTLLFKHIRERWWPLTQQALDIPRANHFAQQRDYLQLWHRQESVHTHSIPLSRHSPLFFGWDRHSPFHSGSRNIDGKLSPEPSPPALRPHIPLPVSLPDRHDLPFHGPE